MESNRRNRLIKRVQQVNLWTIVAGCVGICDGRSASDGIDGYALSSLAHGNADVGAAEEGEGRLRGRWGGNRGGRGRGIRGRGGIGLRSNQRRRRTVSVREGIA